MKKVVWKATLRVEQEDLFTTQLPLDAKIIHFERIPSLPKVTVFVWFETEAGASDEEVRLVTRVFKIIGTGWLIEKDAKHMGTWRDGRFVWHLYQVG